MSVEGSVEDSSVHELGCRSRCRYESSLAFLIGTYIAHGTILCHISVLVRPGVMISTFIPLIERGKRIGALQTVEVYLDSKGRRGIPKPSRGKSKGQYLHT